MTKRKVSVSKSTIMEKSMKDNLSRITDADMGSITFQMETVTLVNGRMICGTEKASRFLLMAQALKEYGAMIKNKAKGFSFHQQESLNRSGTMAKK